jgi:hypothetical protein
MHKEMPEKAGQGFTPDGLPGIPGILFVGGANAVLLFVHLAHFSAARFDVVSYLTHSAL